MARKNNVDVAAVEQAAAEGKQDPRKLRRTQRIEGEWLLAEGGPQFRAEIAYENGRIVLEADQPNAQGGSGSRPSPIHYCSYGMAACYTATYAMVASQMGITLHRLTVRVETGMDYSRAYGLSEAPPVQGVKMTLQVQADAPKAKLQEVEQEALQRCPAVYCLTQPIKLDMALEVVA
ncbi:MAG: OsmC family protein [Chloroflexi bacterium]|nr:OsmC family protein [Chloroflexota bacterium]